MISELRLKVIASKRTIGNIDREEAREMAKELLALRQQFTDGWVPWCGGEQPAGDIVQVEVKLRDGNLLQAAAGMFDWCWGLYDRDIMAYRIVE